MKQSSWLSVGLLVATLTSMASAKGAPAMPRERLSFNTDWRLQKSDPANLQGRLSYDNIKTWLLPSSADFVESKPKPVRPEGNLDGGPYAQPTFDDAGWRKLNLPQDWGIEGPFIPFGQPGSDGATGRLPYAGIGWYRKHFTLPASDAGRRISIEIDGAMSYASVWCNGQFAGGWPFGYASFGLDLTPYIKAGAENVIAIRLENYDNSSRWYPGGGIYRNVWLVKTSPIHVAHWGTYLTTPEVTKAASLVNLKVKVENRSAISGNVKVGAQIYEINSDGKRSARAVATATPVDVSVTANASATAALSATVRNPKLWSVLKPNRYVAVTTVEQDGKLVDRYETPFGIRTLKFDPDKGFFLNGEHVKINGVCDHHDLGALGSAINRRALERQLEILREMGCNAIRTSHNPPAPELLDLADELGFLVMDETFDTWRQQKRPNDYNWLFADWHEQDTRMLVRRDRNHPSVIMWSVGNEVGEQGRGEDGAAVARELVRIVKEEDPTRPTTAAQNSARAGSPFAAALDVLGLNYQGSRLPTPQYPSFKQSFPDRFIYGSETASTISSRGEYVFPVTTNLYGVISGDGGGGGRRGGGAGGPPPGQDVTNHQMSSYDLYFPSWATSPDMEFAAQDRFPYVGGEFVWTGFDYIGEPTPWGGGNDPSRSSYFGIIDLAGFPKDRFYIYQAQWRPDFPMAHILPHWNWPDRLGQVTPVHVYTSGDEAELFLNGKSQGRRMKEQYQYRLRWDEVVYEPGELKVVAYKNGKKWATGVVKTTGPAAKLTLKPDRGQIRAEENDLSFVTVTVADKDGLLVPRSKNQIKFSVEGPGEIVATDNGDATSFESFQSPDRKAFNGLALVIIRAKPGQTGAITLKAQSEGLKESTVRIRSQRAN